MQIRIYYEDTDCGGVVYHSNYLNFCERARSDLFFDQGLSPHADQGHFVVRKISARFVSPAKLGDLVEVKTALIRLKSASLSLDQRIFLGDQLLFECEVELAFVQNGKPKRIDETIKNQFETALAR